MVSKTQIEKGIANYLDSEFMPKLHTDKWKEVLIGTAASIMVRRVGAVVDSMSCYKVITTLGIIDGNGDVDLDILTEEIKKNVPPEGFAVQIPVLGEITLYQSDVEKLYRKITEVQP